MPMIEAIAFDFDGVLADNTQAHTEARMLAFRRAAITTEDARYALVPLRVHKESYPFGESSSAIIAHILGVSGITLDDTVVKQIHDDKKQAYLNRARQGLPAVAGALDFVAWGQQEYGAENLAITTRAGLLYEVKPFLALHGLTKSFGHVITKEDVPRGKQKPDPYIYLEAARRLGIPPENMAGVEDSPIGSRAARLAGAYTIAMTNTRDAELFESAYPQPSAIVDTFDDVKLLLRRAPSLHIAS